MKAIELNNGMFAYVEDCDYLPLIRWLWCYHKDGYACRKLYLNNQSYMIYMHRQILGLTDRAVECDHINGNRLDNRFSNLRVVTRLQNARNKHNIPQHKGSSRYRGVYYDKTYSKWRAHIWYNGKTITLGSHDYEIDAALAYNSKAIELFGTQANLNVILELTSPKDTD